MGVQMTWASNELQNIQAVTQAGQVHRFNQADKTKSLSDLKLSRAIGINLVIGTLTMSSD
jgi:hypothetical protein